MSRPTPETDAESCITHIDCEDSCCEVWVLLDGKKTDGNIVTRDFARRLERERDKAREDATNYYARIGELEKERDEARERAAKLAAQLLTEMEGAK